MAWIPWLLVRPGPTWPPRLSFCLEPNLCAEGELGREMGGGWISAKRNCLSLTLPSLNGQTVPPRMQWGHHAKKPRCWSVATLSGQDCPGRSASSRILSAERGRKNVQGAFAPLLWSFEQWGSVSGTCQTHNLLALHGGEAGYKA